MSFFSKFKQDLINPLCNSIDVVKHKQVNLLEIIIALQFLLELDIEYPNDLVDEDSVKFMIDSASGFDSLTELQSNQNEEVQAAVLDLLNKHYVPYSGQDTQEFLENENKVN